MVRRATGLFAGFDLENNHCLRELAIALEYWLAGGRDRQKSKQMKELSPLQKSTVEMIAQRMTNSPLLTDIITPFLQAPRFGGNHFLTAARDLADYAIPLAEEPRAAAYQDALAAWQNRWPLRIAHSVLPDHEARTKAAMTEASEVRRRGVAARGVVVDDVSESTSLAQQLFLIQICRVTPTMKRRQRGRERRSFSRMLLLKPAKVSSRPMNLAHDIRVDDPFASHKMSLGTNSKGAR